MALRSMTHRYLRNRLGGPTRHKIPPPSGLGPQLAGLFGHHPPVRYRTVPGAGDKLYEALRDVLRYDWQARLVPYYAPLPVSLVRNLGERLLEYKAPGDLEQLAADYASGMATSRTYRPSGGAGDVGKPSYGPTALPVNTSNRRLGGMSEDDIWAIYQQSDLRKRLGQFGDEQQGRRLVALAASVGPDVGKMLTQRLHLNKLQMVAATCALADVVGPSRFLSLFADPGVSAACEIWHDALVASRLPTSRTLDQVAEPSRMAAMTAATEITTKGL